MRTKNIFPITVLLLTAYCLLPTLVFSQSPQAFKYQSIVRDVAGNPMATATVTVRATVHDGSATGTTVYQETHAATTNQFGLITLEIGNGTPVSGTFSSISWGTGTKWMQIEADFGSGFVAMGASQLLSVPYALYAGNGGTPGPTGPAGSVGTTGAIGTTGAQGPTGLQGTAGSQGPTGPQGIAGVNGTTGAQGTTGSPGVTGGTGPQGIAGTNGANGTTGHQGIVGATGATGNFGAAGTTGQTIYHNGTTWIATSNLYNSGAIVGIGTTNPNSSAILDLSSTTQGVLPPRMTTSERDLIPTPSVGLHIFNTTTNCDNIYAGSYWKQFCGECDFTPAVPSSNSPITIGRTLSLTATTVTGATYSWTGPNGFTSSIQNPTLTNMRSISSGNYSLITSLNGCSSSSTNLTVIVLTPSGGAVTQSGGYNIHTFTSSGTFITELPITIDVLVVAGGGSGGNSTTTNANGGGGGGGVLYSTSYSLAAGIYAVTVGDGGAAIFHSTCSTGNNGGNSVFSVFTAIGGGGGGSSCIAQGKNGGSGGGGAYNFSTAGTANQPGGYANAGGLGNYTWTGGGGGGAGSAGVNGNACGNCAPSGNGGTGISYSISGTTQYYAGGGGGGGNSSERAGDGFDGGGRGFGTTSYYGYNNYPIGINPTTRGSSTPNAIPNTGGGGGGGSYWANNVYWFTGSGAGGSGIVIIRY
ncbi:MAG: collagen-like protein [Bacteroidetes bacterium]|nr:MAG: collagen-like protein [Bacteroidota bacterium]